MIVIGVFYVMDKGIIIIYLVGNCGNKVVCIVSVVFWLFIVVVIIIYWYFVFLLLFGGYGF